MKIIFMGTPEFSVPTLEKLIESEHEIIGCYTQPDKPKGRGKKLQYTPVKEMCIKEGIPVYQPLKIRDKESVEQFKSLEADVAVVIAYGQILPESILYAPKYGCINIHASLLPKYRGAAPYQWAVINRESTTGITTMQMDKGMDTGDMLLKTVVDIGPDETAGSLHDKLMDLGGNLILDTLKQLEANTLTPVKQNNDEATYAPMLDKNFGKINWHKSAKEIEALIRGLNPWPSAYTFFDDKLLKIWKAEVIEKNMPDFTNGTICEIREKEGFVVNCESGALLVKELQLQGKKRMDAPSFMRGNQVVVGAILE